MGIYQFLANRGLDPSLAETDKWSGVGLDASESSLETDERFIRLQRGVKRYCANEGSFRSIAAEICVAPTTLERAVNRCFTFDDCGNLFGWAGLIKYLHVNEYVRTNPTDTNCSGMFDYVLNNYRIEDELRRVILGKHKDYGRVRRIKDLHGIFMDLLDKSGAPKHQYPYIVENEASEALRLFVERVRNSKPIQSTSLLVGPSAARKIGRAMKTDTEARQFLEPYEWVEIDAHKIDGIIVLRFRSLDGVPVSLTLERIWLIAVIEVKTTNILGYTYAFGRNPTKDDVAEALTRAVVPQKRLDLTIEGLKYPDRAGFPAANIKGCGYRLFDVVHLDNDMAHWANALHDDLCFKGGGIVHIGKGDQPDDRPNIENWFNTFEQNVLHRFEITTGSHPQDPVRRDPEKAAKRYEFDFDILYQTTDVWIADKNGTPPPGAPRAAPLIHLQESLAVSDALPRRVPPDERIEWSFHDEWVIRKVKGGGKDKTPPYIKYKKVRYSSDRLKNRWDLIGKNVRVKIYRPDMQRLKVYLMDGTYFDTVLIAKAWRVPHSLFVRKLYTKLMKRNELTRGEDIARTVWTALLKRARKSKKHRNDLLRLAQERPDLAGEESTIGPLGEERARIRQSKPGLDSRLDEIEVPRRAIY